MQRIWMVGFLAATVASGLFSTAGAETVSLTPVKDNSLFSNGNSNGAGESLFSGRTGDFSVPPGMTLRALLAFDVAGNIPAGSTVTSASLTLTLLQASLFGQDEAHTLHRVLQDWGQGTSAGIGGGGAPPTAGDATWMHTFYPDQFWSTAGGDFDAAPSATQTVSTVPGPFTWDTPQVVADVQDMLDTPGTNFGWMLRGNEVDFFSARRWASKEWFVQEQLPTLVIEFTPPSCVGDVNADGAVGPLDLGPVLGTWGPCPGCPADVDGDAVVGVTDLALVLGNWGPCGGPQCSSDGDCQDDDLCNGLEVCVMTTCLPGTPLDCDDGSACTADACDPAGGCDNSPVDCDDGDACTADSCDAQSGCINDPLSCDDADPCTTDACDPAAGCTNTSIDCDDGDACTADSCDPAGGFCINDPVDCDDGNACTADACDPASGCINDPVSCDDGDVCTTDSCDPAGGACINEPGACILLERQIATGNDDAEEDSADGSMDLTSSDLELAVSGSTDTVGMRFTAITIPPGSTIQSAAIQFTVDEVTTGPVSLTITGEDTDDAAQFTNTNADITSRTTTMAAVSWSPPGWDTVGQAGPEQRTPDISSIIQEIIDRPGWTDGNALVIIVTGSGTRTAESFNGVSSAAPLLQIEYGPGE